MADNDWGWLAQFESFGRLDDSKEDFKTLDYSDAKTKYPTHKHASHGMIFARDDRMLWDLYPCRGTVLMQMRFDGVLGFPGGLVEEGEDPVFGLNREMVEEIGLDLDKHKFTDSDHVASFINNEKKLLLHFYVLEVSLDEFKMLELRNLQAEEYGIETYGIVRPPLFTMGDGIRGLPAFLANQFAGNAKEEFLMALQKCKLLTKEQIETALKQSQLFIKQRYSLHFGHKEES